MKFLKVKDKLYKVSQEIDATKEIEKLKQEKEMFLREKEHTNSRIEQIDEQIKELNNLK